MEGESTILLGKVWRMRKSETMRAASRLLLSHPIFCLLAVLAAVVVLGVLGPLKVVHAADVAVEDENFDRQPTGTRVVTDTIYHNGKALSSPITPLSLGGAVTFTSRLCVLWSVLTEGGAPSSGERHGTLTARAGHTNIAIPEPTPQRDAPSGDGR